MECTRSFGLSGFDGIQAGNHHERLFFKRGNKASGTARDKVRSISRFVEKPTRQQAAKLIEDGALWNSFVFAAQCDTLLILFRNRMPDTAAKFQALLGEPMTHMEQLTEICQTLASTDLSGAIECINKTA